MRMARAIAALLAVLTILLPAAARADERILHFSSDIAVQADSSLEVSEAIRVRAEGNAIKHGIFRDFPTSRGGSFWAPNRVGFQLVEVRRDGAIEPSKIENISGGIRIRIGSADTFLPYGEHDYVIRYRTTRQIGYFDTFDELNWNVTGNYWQFPIDVAEAHIRLPQPVSPGEHAVYTGPTGARGTAAAVVDQRPGDITFRTTAPLGPQEGLTVAVAWPKGVVATPGDTDRAGFWLTDYGPFAVGLAGLLGILIYYFIAWRRAGHGPAAGTIVPIFAPPDGLSAAGMRYIVDMGADNRTFAAALVELGVRGRLRLVEGEKGFFSRAKTTIERQSGSALGDVLPKAESAMMSALFAGNDSIVMEQKNHATFSAAQAALAKQLKAQYEGTMFVRNWGWSLRGLALMLGALWLTACALILASSTPSPLPFGLVLLGLTGFTVSAILFNGAHSTLVKILAGIVAVAAAGIGFATIVAALNSGAALPLVLPLLSLPVVLTAFSWMAAPTRQGRQVLDRIAGFEQYLSITEEDQLDRMHPPEKTPALFEKYLPYAIALGVENRWAKRFAGVLAAASAAGTAHAMTWYSGSSDPWSHTDDFVDTIGSTLSSTVASASASPGSSGGGSSGGGGGGGGGGGW
jgi:uncharacterized membrane protein YgcG